MKGKIITSLRNFAQLSAVQGFENIGITAKEMSGVSASMAFEVPAPAGAAAEKGLINGKRGIGAAPAGPETAERTFAELN